MQMTKIPLVGQSTNQLVFDPGPLRNFLRSLLNNETSLMIADHCHPPLELLLLLTSLLLLLIIHIWTFSFLLLIHIWNLFCNLIIIE